MFKNYLATLLIGCWIDPAFSQPDSFFPPSASPSSAHVSAHAEATATAANPVVLPRCIDTAGDIAEIQRAQKANPHNAHKYDGYRSMLRADTDIELATRLAYAEVLAANCPRQENRLIELIASVIGNRIRIRHGDIKGVVFQRDQFASSLNIYAESRYRDFLCPAHRERWEQAYLKMYANLVASNPTAPVPADAVNYYLYRHSERFTAPDWKLEEVQIEDREIRECIRVFRNSAWK